MEPWTKIKTPTVVDLFGKIIKTTSKLKKTLINLKNLLLRMIPKKIRKKILLSLVH